MKIYPFLLICCSLLIACDRPIPHLPGTQTSLGQTQEAQDTQPITPPRQDTNSTQTENSPLSAVSPTLPLTSATDGRLTPTMESTSLAFSTPAWCPVKPAMPVTNGKLRVVYASQGNLWLQDEGGTASRLSQPGDIQQVSLSEDGQIIAYTRKLDEHHEELWAIDADGSNARRLVDAVELTQLDGNTDALGVLPTALQWEPGSHHLVFFTYPLYEALWIFEPSKPWLVDVDTWKVSAAPYQGGNVAYALDGKLVAIFNSNLLSVIHIDGSDLQEDILPEYHGIGLGESFFTPFPFWAKDSTSLLVAIPDQNDMYTRDSSVTIWRVPVKGRPKALGQWNAFAPSVTFSPDLATMAYWPWPEGTANLRELHLVRLMGETTGQVKDTIYMRGELIDSLAWSPDSQHFIFVTRGNGQTTWFYLGNICQPAKLFLEVENSGTATWIDASRYLLEINPPNETDTWELHLGTVDQEQAEMLGVVTSYDWVILP